MKATPLALPDVLLLEPRVFDDNRGEFFESFNTRTFAEFAGRDIAFVQDNQSVSRRGVVRGLHYQVAPAPQGKLVRVLVGAIFDVAVDIRAGSPWYGKHVAVELSADNGKQLYVPAGFAHGFCTLEPDTELQYKVSDYYSPECDSGIRFDDPDLAIAWPVNSVDAVLSEKDRRLPKLADLVSSFRYES